MTAHPAGALSGRRVMVVEDHKDTRDMMREILELEGATVSGAASADEALRMLNNATVDAVLVDVGLGSHRHDGPWLLRQILNSPRLAKTCVIAITGRKELERELLKLGFSAVLIKPIEVMDLSAFIIGCLEQTR
jgi:CheY-like chemotaxis protein